MPILNRQVLGFGAMNGKRLLLAGAAGIGLAAAAGAGPAAATRPSLCPSTLLPLARNALTASKSAALHATSRAARPVVVSADRATADRDRGGEAKRDCGKQVWSRTVVVYLTLRAYEPSASLSERVVFVGRFDDGYRVWQIVH
jgi:hypothetical protein